MTDVVAAHKHSIYHRQEVEKSELCGCFHCTSTFTPDTVNSWTDEGTTALCPKCGIDSVIGSASGFPISKVFLSAMKKHWF